MARLKLGVLGSGKGSNFRAIADAIARGELDAEVRIVISDLEDAGILALARERGIRAEFVHPGRFKTKMEPEREQALASLLMEAGVEWVVLAGYMRMVKAPLLRAFPRRIINIHPSLLPAFPGLEAWKQAVEAGAVKSGCTMHFVDEGMDTGEIIARAEVPVLPNDTPESLHARIQVEEHKLYPAVLRIIAADDSQPSEEISLTVGHQQPPPVPSFFQKPRPIPFKVSRNRRIAAMVSIALPLLYAGFFRWIFNTELLREAGGVVSLAFIWSVPFAVGALCVAIGRWSGSDNLVRYAVFVPCVVLILGLLICLVTKMEAAICVIMAAPIMIGCTLLGGLLADFLLPRNCDDSRLKVTFIVFLPFIAAYVEGSCRWPTETKAIETTITIDAPAETIWTEIASVPAIAPEQIPNKWVYRVGFPKPIAAMLDREGVGGIRTATFERDVSFFETVTIWDRPKKLAFTIHADPNFVPHTAFDQHIIVGGRFYDVLDGIYEIEPLSDTACRLHLTSHHRLSTRFNAYAGWWSEKIMDQIHGSILEVIRQRAEARAGLRAISAF
jgi:phosphoribosylglycinamide formyltransferase-1